MNKIMSSYDDMPGLIDDNDDFIPELISDNDDDDMPGLIASDIPLNDTFTTHEVNDIYWQIYSYSENSSYFSLPEQEETKIENKETDDVLIEFNCETFEIDENFLEIIEIMNGSKKL